MPLKKPHFNQDIIESATDPTGNSSYTVLAGSLWLDTGSTPSVLYERNTANTGWNRLTSQVITSGIITISIGTAQDTWIGTVNHSGITSTSEVTLTVNANGNQTTTVFLPNVTNITSGSFSWWVGAFKKLTGQTIYLHYTVRA